jgi:hypothetical protein
VIVGDAVSPDVGAGALGPLSDSEINAGVAPSAPAARAIPTRPTAERQSTGLWPATTGVGFALALLLGIALILQWRRGRRMPEAD